MHVLRKDDDWVKKCMEYEVEGPRPKRTISSLFFCIKLHIMKNKNCCHQSCTFLTPICTKSFVCWGLRLRPLWGAYSAPPDPLAVFSRPTCLANTLLKDG